MSLTPFRRHARLMVAIAAAAVAVAAVVWWAGRPERDRDESLRLARGGDFAAAEPLLAAAADRNPWDAEVAAALARGYLATADPRAESVLSRWIKSHPHDPEPVRLRMGYYWERKDPRVVKDAKQLVRMECRDPEVRYQVMEYAYAFAEYEEAESRCDSLIKRDPDNPELRVKLADIRRARGNPAGAAAALDAVLKDHPAHRQALLARAELCQAAGRYDDAVPLLRRALAADPARRREVGDQLAAALEQAGRPDEADRVRAEAGRPPDARP